MRARIRGLRGMWIHFLLMSILRNFDCLFHLYVTARLLVFIALVKVKFVHRN